MAEGNLLIGILALQMDFVSRDALIHCIDEWSADKSRSLTALLIERGHLTREAGDLLDDLARKHVEAHGNDLRKSLVALRNARAATAAHFPEVEDFEARDTLEMAADASTQSERPSTSAGIGSSGDPYRFEVLRPHAKGGLGIISVALDQHLHREVALKELKDEHAADGHRQARFLMEAEVTGSLEHPGIVPVYALGAYPDGRPYYAMRFIRGDCYRDVIDRYHKQQQNGFRPGEQPIPLRTLLRRFVDVCNAISYAHSKNVVHRDIKPENVMLGPFGETLVVDWGLAKVRNETGEPLDTKSDSAASMIRASTQELLVETLDGTMMGTPAYMSPEQARGAIESVGPASDVYSLGAALYCLLTNQAPFEKGSLADVLQRVRKGDFAKPSAVYPITPPALEAVCLKAMANDPADRYGSARELGDDVERWLADEPVHAHREPWTVRAERWVRRHQTGVAALTVLLITAVLALTISTVFVTRAWRDEEKARVAHALTLVNELRVANPKAVPTILESLRREPALVEPELLHLWHSSDESVSRHERMRIGLALLPDRVPGVQEELFEWMMIVDDPREMLLIRDGLWPHKDRWRDKLRERVDASSTSDERRFHALVALAEMDAGNRELWVKHAPDVVARLLRADPLVLSAWSDALRSVRAHLIGPLKEAFRDAEQQGHRLIAANLLAEHGGTDPSLLDELLTDADAEQYAVLLPKIKQLRERMLPSLRSALQAPLPADVEQRERLARRQAVVAVTLIHLGEPDPAWPLLGDRRDPTRRTYFLHRLAPFGVEPKTLLEQLLDPDRHDDHARRALLLSLGECDPKDLAPDDKKRLLELLFHEHERNPDPGIHGATDWLLRQDVEGPSKRNFALGGAKDLRAVDQRLKEQFKSGLRVGKKPGWHVTPSGLTLTVIPGPVTFSMGSPKDERGRRDNETLHDVTIPHSFAAATKEVTVVQFEAFKKDLEQKHGITLAHVPDDRYCPSEQGPVIAVTWFEAIQFCRWLSEKENVPTEQMCYPAVAEIEKWKDDPKLIRFPDDFLARTGYRLPTEEEWEYAGRSGSSASRHFGSPDDLLQKYAWFVETSRDQVWPVGQKRPNDFGLFDVHGNVAEWCHDELTRTTGKHVTRLRAMRGGAFAYRASSQRAALRDGDQPQHRFYTAGLRVARTCVNP